MQGVGPYGGSEDKGVSMRSYGRQDLYITYLTPLEFLSQQGVSCQEFDVTQDQKTLEEMVHLSGRRAVPVIVIDGDVIVGFDQDAIKHKLAAQGNSH